MANPEHLEILKKGVKAWNKWRERQDEVVPNLKGINLSGINLSGANLSYAHFGGSWLEGALLNSANLADANLSYTHLSHANLSHANLSYTNLSYADLRHADLSYANLILANPTRAFVKGADFTNSQMGYTAFAEIDLSEAKGLEAIEHLYPSNISTDTLYISAGRIPEIFLRGCGVPEDFITYMRSLITQPIQFYKSFISYSSKDQKFADRLYADLQSKGVRCWLATENLKIGAKIRLGIDEAIKLHDKLLLVLSKHSVASDWVEQEVETALERERKEKRTVLFPIRLDDAVMDVESGWPALVRNTRNIGDFRKWKNHDSYQKAFDRLLRDLKAEKKQA